MNTQAASVFAVSLTIAAGLAPVCAEAGAPQGDHRPAYVRFFSGVG